MQKRDEEGQVTTFHEHHHKLAELLLIVPQKPRKQGHSTCPQRFGVGGLNLASDSTLASLRPQRVVTAVLASQHLENSAERSVNHMPM